MRQSLNELTTNTRFNPYYDVTGAPLIDSTDYVDVRARLNDLLPSAAPSPQTSEVGSLGTTGDDADVGGLMLAVQEAAITSPGTGSSAGTASSVIGSGGNAGGSSGSGSSGGNGAGSSESSGSSPASAATSASAASTQATDQALSELDLADLWT